MHSFIPCVYIALITQRYTALAQPGQAPPLPAHFRYYLGSCLRAAGDDMTALEFFTQQIAIYQDEMQLLVASAGDEAEAALIASEPPRWFNTCAAPWARLAGIYASAEVTPPAFAFQSARVHLLLCLHERAEIFRGLNLDVRSLINIMIISYCVH